MRMRSFAAVAGIVAAPIIGPIGCGLGNPQVSRDPDDPINRANAAVEVSVGGMEQFYDENSGQVLERSKRGIDGTFWSQEVASGNMDSTQFIKFDSPAEEGMAALAAIGNRDNVTENHVELAKIIQDVTRESRERQTYDSHEFTVTAMQDSRDARLATVAKYNNQRNALNRNTEFYEQGVNVGKELGLAYITGGGTAGAAAVQRVVAVVAERLGLSRTETAELIDDNPELSRQLQTLSGSPGFVDGSLTLEQASEAIKQITKLFDEVIELREHLDEKLGESVPATSDEGVEGGDPDPAGSTTTGGPG